MAFGRRFKAATRAELARKATPNYVPPDIKAWHKNPILITYNPPIGLRRIMPKGTRIVGQIASDVYLVRYIHSDDEENYEHEFEGEVFMFGIEQPDGQRDILITGKDGQPLWQEFE